MRRSDGDGLHELERPRVVLSRCLELEACRYNGQSISSEIVRLIQPYVDFLPVCPEVEIGLGVPRDPIRLVQLDAVGSDGGEQAPGAPRARLVQPGTGRDLTAEMNAFSDEFSDRIEKVDGMILKSRSPTCGTGDVKVYAAAENSPVHHKDAGAFADVVMHRFPEVPIEDEGRLTNAEIRHHFLTRLFAMAALRAALQSGPSGLVAFHTRYKLVLMAHSPSGQRALGRLLADMGGEFDRLAGAYRRGFAEALAKPASHGAHINTIQHAQGYFKEGLTPREKARFLEMQADYRKGRLPIQALLAVLDSWIERFDEPYLRGQAYFRPYPVELVTAADSGRGRLG